MPRRCDVSPHETRLRAFVAALFATPGLLRAGGSIVDCGAEKGGEACWLAELDASRRVVAIEPMLRNIRVIQQYATSHRNIVPLRGGLGSVDRIVDMRDTAKTPKISMVRNLDRVKAADPRAVNGSDSSLFSVWRLSSLFGPGGDFAQDRLAFAHFDAEGAELDILAGAAGVIARDRPVFTIEIEVGKRISRFSFAQALDVVRAWNYSVYVVPEVCGVEPRCRNAVCFPSERQPSQVLLAAHNMTESMPGQAVSWRSFLPPRG